MDAYTLPTYFPLAYSELQYLASRRAAAVAAATGTLPPLPPHQPPSSAGVSQPGHGQPPHPHDFHPAYRIPSYMDHLYSLQRASPTPSFHGLGISSDYMGSRGPLNDIHPAGSLASTDFHFNLDSSRHNNSRPGSIRASISRKRALSSSPYSEMFDINSMIRFSPNSLTTIVNGSRNSSTSGSYGHLSAGTLSPNLGIHSNITPHLQQLQAHLLRAGSGLLHPIPSHHNSGIFSLGHHTFQGTGPTLSKSVQFEETTSKNIEQPSSTSGEVVQAEADSASHLMTVSTASRRYRSKRESNFIPQETETVDTTDIKDEPGDFMQTNCHWRDCVMEFSTREDLVKHISNDHIQINKKLFVCRWEDCSRNEKPFKAQYMLVVHMRRHTGEKPHKCTFEGCDKAYSRLENLKTHLRSHTGEKPYTCEYPGCSKAFSNASDRAKHQNRTHSNEKPYICKAPGCTKRYTDPSSLRKHVKTVHGAEFYANKKHKGSYNESGNYDGTNQRIDFSPRSDDMQSGKTTSLASPSIKSESEGNSPGHPPPINSPISIAHHVLKGNGDDYEWPFDEDDCEVAELPMVLRAMVGIGGGNSEGSSVSAISQSQRFRSRIHSKGMNSTLSNIPELNPYNIGIGELNQKITDLKMEPGTKSTTNVLKPTTSNNMTDLQTRLPSSNYVPNVSLRRDSSNSNASTYYCSMRSIDASRRSSQMSQLSSISTMCPSYNTGSFYDPISPGCSRRSSQNSVATTNGYSLPPQPSSHLVSSHIQHLQSNNNFCNGDHHIRFSIQNQRIPNTNSELSQNLDSVRQLPIINTITNESGAILKQTDSSGDHHPNDEVNLDEFAENEMVEDKLVIPDDMMQYLNQVSDKAGDPTFSPNSESITTACVPQPSNTNNCHPNTKDSEKEQGASEKVFARDSEFQSNTSSRINPNTLSLGSDLQTFCNFYGQQQDQNYPYVPTTSISDQHSCHQLHRTICSSQQVHYQSHMAPFHKNRIYNIHFQASPASVPTTQLPLPLSKSKEMEIQCGDISQSQMSPVIAPAAPSTCSNVHIAANSVGNQERVIAMNTTNDAGDLQDESNNNGMRSDTYQRTLEYVQNCQNWLENTTQIVSSSTHPSSNMIINDMTTSLSSLLEEDRFLQMIQ